jgi:hypothetical protein
MDKMKAFMKAFSDLKQLVPLKERNQLYIGLSSKLEKSMKDYVTERISATVLENLRNYEVEKDQLKERILYLESLLDKAKIKHTISKEEVYPEKYNH